MKRSSRIYKLHPKKIDEWLDKGRISRVAKTRTNISDNLT